LRPLISLIREGTVTENGYSQEGPKNSASFGYNHKKIDVKEQ